MARYINADEFLKYDIKRNGCVPFIDGGNYNVDRLDDEVNYFPTADVREMKYGEWYDVCDNNQQSNYQEEAYGTCSVCKVRGRLRTNRNEYGIWFIDSPYCPNCGAKMDGKEDEE